MSRARYAAFHPCCLFELYVYVHVYVHVYVYVYVYVYVHVYVYVYVHVFPSIAVGLVGVDLDARGIPSEDDYIASYCEQRGLEHPSGQQQPQRRQLPDWTFYMVLALFKQAVHAQRTFHSALNGENWLLNCCCCSCCCCFCCCCCCLCCCWWCCCLLYAVHRRAVIQLQLISPTVRGALAGLRGLVNMGPDGGGTFSFPSKHSPTSNSQGKRTTDMTLDNKTKGSRGDVPMWLARLIRLEVSES